MLALVRIALRRPYTFVVLALLILIFGTLAALRTPTDIFPDIQIPVISTSTAPTISSRFPTRFVTLLPKLLSGMPAIWVVSITQLLPPMLKMG